MPFGFEYELGQHGWARVRLSDGEHIAEETASYLSDPLRGALRMAAYLLEDKEMRRQHYHRKPDFVSFEAEPGGLILRLDLATDADPASPVEFMVSRCQDQCLGEDFQLQVTGEEPLFAGSTDRVQFATAVFQAAGKVLKAHGFAEYRKRWIEHEFPLTEFARLACFMGEKELALSL